MDQQRCERRITVRQWVWVPMPEKSYRGRVTISDFGTEIEMIDPIPNRFSDQCYGETTNAKTVSQAVRKFAQGMLQDRQKYFGDRGWRPDRETRRRLWKRRGERRQEIEKANGSLFTDVFV